MTCGECGKRPVTVRRENHRYTQCGLDYVTLMGIEVRHCPECGQTEYVIPNIEQLHRVIAQVVAKKPEQLVPHEVRFLRKYLGLSSSAFAKAMGVRPETISRWEKTDAVRPMPSGLERLLRLMVLNQRPAAYYPPEQVAELATKQPAASRVKVASVRGGWHAEGEARAA